jgi:hypothetical protein
MCANKKIKNATSVCVNGIEFKSKLEGRVYEILLSNGFDPQYEAKTLVLWEGFRPTKPYYSKTKTKLNYFSPAKLKDITYTPDFYFKYNDLEVFIEVKGFMNDVYPLKKKMFRKHLESLDNVIAFEIYTLTQLKEAINMIKSYGNTSKEN